MKRLVVCLVSGLVAFGAMASVGLAQDTQTTTTTSQGNNPKEKGKKTKKKAKKRTTGSNEFNWDALEEDGYSAAER